jgi:hypothetical protein
MIMGYAERTFIALPEELQELRELQSPWRDEANLPTEAEVEASARLEDRIHAYLTAAIFLCVALVGWMAGLRIAPIACLIFSAVLLLADIGRHASPPER